MKDIVKLSFKADHEGGLKLDKDGDSILKIKPSLESLDLNLLGYFHRRQSVIHIQGAQRDLNCAGYIHEVDIKSEVSFKFICTDEVDLNLIHALCKDPEPWQVRIEDQQTELPGAGTPAQTKLPIGADVEKAASE